MGLSSLPAPSEGVLGVILVNTAISISIFKGIVRSILHVVGIHLSAPSSSDSMENSPESIDFCLNPNGGYIEEFRSRIPAILFDEVRSCKWLEHDCSVCLIQFEPESEINHLSCGHVFHRVCLEKWLDYWNVTCPLCRTPLMPEEETASCFLKRDECVTLCYFIVNMKLSVCLLCCVYTVLRLPFTSLKT